MGSICDCITLTSMTPRIVRRGEPLDSQVRPLAEWERQARRNNEFAMVAGQAKQLADRIGEVHPEFSEANEQQR